VVPRLLARSLFVGGDSGQKPLRAGLASFGTLHPGDPLAVCHSSNEDFKEILTSETIVQRLRLKQKTSYFVSPGHRAQVATT
jgi:hypothetical protein